MGKDRLAWSITLSVSAAAMAVGFLPVAAMAEQASPTGAEPGEAPAGGLEDIVVTARRSNERAQDVPLAITTLTAQTLKDLNTRDLVDVQKVTPGLFVSTVQLSGKARLAIRGQVAADDRLTGDRSIGVYIDGAPFEHDYGLTTSLVDLARIEVLKGPQGTLFGKNTTGGAFNITTQHPEYRWGGYVDMLYGSYNKMQGLAVINAPLIQDKLAIRAVGQITSRDGYYTDFGGRDAGDDHSVFGRLLIRADPAENVRVLLSADYVNLRNHAVHIAMTSETMLASQNSATAALGAIAKELGLDPTSAADRLTAYNTWRTYFDAQVADPRKDFQRTRDPYDRLDHWGVSANIEVDLGAVTLRSITGFRRLTRAIEFEFDGTPFELFNQRQTARDSNFSQEIQLSSIDGAGLDWQLGAFYNRETGNDFTANDTNFAVNNTRSVITDSDIVSSSQAVYGQAIYNLGERLRFTGGIRFTHDYREIISHNRIDTAYAFQPIPPGVASRCNLLDPALGGPAFPNCNQSASTKGDKVTWLASIDWKPVPGVMVYGSVSTGYRAGAFTAPGNSTPIATVAASEAAFTPYRPETVTNYQLGFKADLFDRRLRINGAAFYQDCKDIQVRVRDVVNGVIVTLVRNAAKATLYGGELELTAMPTRNLTLTAGAAYLHAKYNEYRAVDSAGNVVDLSAQEFSSPKWSFNVGGAYTVPLVDGSLRLSANYSWRSRVNFTPSIAVDPASLSQEAYGLLDGRISWEIDSQGLEIAVFGKNLTDKIYRASAASAGPWNFANIGEPRTFGIQARKTF